MLLAGIAAHLEEQALKWREAPVVLSSFETGERVSASDLSRYGELAAAGAFVAILGPDLDVPPGSTPRIRVARFSSDAPLAEEWNVVLVGAHYSGALVARHVGPGDCSTSPSRTIAISSSKRAVRFSARSSRLRPDLRDDSRP